MLHRLIALIAGGLMVLLTACRHEPRGLVPGRELHVRFPDPKSGISAYAAMLYTAGGSEYLAYSSASSKKIQTVDIHTNKPAMAISLQGVDSMTDLEFYRPRFFIQGPDSVFVLPDESKTLFLLGRDGRVQHRWDLFRRTDYDYVLSGFPTNPLLFYNQKIYVRFVPKLNAYKEKSVYYKIPPALTISIGKELAGIRAAGGWPVQYQTENYYDTYPYICLNTGHVPEQLVYSFAADPALYVYEGTRLVKKSFAGSDAIPTFRPFDDDSIGNTGYTMRYLGTAPKYANITYDPYRRLFYRLAMHQTDPLSKDGKTRKHLFDQPWSLIVLDQQFRKKAEVPFDPSEYAYGPMYVCREGLMIPRRKPRQEEAKDCYEWDFVIFKPDL